jgi:hypothetical protein
VFLLQLELWLDHSHFTSWRLGHLLVVFATTLTAGAAIGVGVIKEINAWLTSLSAIEKLWTFLRSVSIAIRAQP